MQTDLELFHPSNATRWTIAGLMLAALNLAHVYWEAREALAKMPSNVHPQILDELCAELEAYEKTIQECGRQAALELSALPMGYGLNWPLLTPTQREAK